MKLEYNSYDYEDDYKYMITIDDDFVSGIEISDELVESFTEIVGRVLSSNLKIHVGREIGDKLIVYSG